MVGLDMFFSQVCGPLIVISVPVCNFKWSSEISFELVTVIVIGTASLNAKDLTVLKLTQTSPPWLQFNLPDAAPPGEQAASKPIVKTIVTAQTPSTKAGRQFGIKGEPHIAIFKASKAPTPFFWAVDK
jgi:hypothetical protein